MLPVSVWACTAVSTSHSLAVLSHDAVTICLPVVNQSAALREPKQKTQLSSILYNIRMAFLPSCPLSSNVAALRTDGVDPSW